MRHAEYSLNPLILMYPRTVEGRRVFVAETRAGDAPLILLVPRVGRALLTLPESFTKQEALQRWDSLQIKRHEGVLLWRNLIAEKFILTLKQWKRDHAMFLVWKSRGWGEAYRYHRSTKDYPFIQMNTTEGMEADINKMKTYFSVEKAPSPYQSFQNLKSIKLRKINEHDSLNHRVTNMSEKEKRGIGGLSILFDLCVGQRGKMQFSFQGVFLHKSIPSGGARHLTEVFFFVFHHPQLIPGLYHYNVKTNSLDLISKGDFFDKCKHATFDLFDKYQQKPFGMIVLTSLVERAMWRYRESRSWRAVLVDIGHALMALRDVTEALHISSYTYQKFRDTELADLIGVDVVRQPPLYVMTLI